MMERGRREAKTPRRRTRRKKLKMKPLTTVRMMTDKIERFRTMRIKSPKYQL